MADEQTYEVGQDLVGGLGDLKEDGFLEGAIVLCKDGRFGKMDQEFEDRQNKGNKIKRSVIAAKYTLITRGGVNGKELKPQEYSTGIPWDNDDVTVSADGKALVPKRRLTKDEVRKLISKQSNYGFFIKHAVLAGYPEDKLNPFRADQFDGKTIQMTNEKPAKDRKPLTVFGHFTDGATAAAPSATAAPTSAAPTVPTVSDAAKAGAQNALFAIVTAAGAPVAFMDLFSKQLLNNYFGQAGVNDPKLRSDITNAIWSTNGNTAAQAALVDGSPVKASGGVFSV